MSQQEETQTQAATENLLWDLGYNSQNELDEEIAGLERVAARTCTVLVADDIQSMRLLLVSAIRSLGFSQVERAAEGETALKVLKQRKCDLALVDWNMPRQDGLQLLNAVRAHPDLKRIIFIMITAETLDKKVMRIAEEQQDAYLTKPVSPEKLTRRLQLILDKRLTTARSLFFENQGLADKAIEQFMAAIHNRPQARWPLFGLGGLMARQGRTEEAMRCYRRLLELDESALAAKLEMGRLLEKLGQVDEARNLYKASIAGNPQFFRAYDVMASSLYQEGQHLNALEVLNGAMEQQGTENPVRQELVGRLNYDLGRYAAAEEAIAKAIDLRPNQASGDNHMLLSRALLAQGRWEDALPKLDQAAKLAAACLDSPQRVDAMLLKGSTFARLNRGEEAEKVFKTLTVPENWPGQRVPFAINHFHREVGGIYLDADMEQDALRHLKASMIMDPDDEGNQESMERMCLLKGRPDLARRAVEAGIRAREEELEECSRQGLAMVNQGRFQDALEEYRRGLARDPQAGRLYYNLGKLQFRLGNLEEAWSAIASAARHGLNRKDWELSAAVSLFLAEHGQVAQALGILDKVLQEEPGQSHASQVLANLQGKAATG